MRKTLIGLMLVTACIKKECTFSELDYAHQLAKENTMVVARAFRDANPVLKDIELVFKGDNTQSEYCLQGDGWADVDFITAEGEALKYKCSTISKSMGCVSILSKKSSVYLDSEGKCNKFIPFPLLKID